MKRETIFSPCRCYRYTLWREWEPLFNPDYLQVIGLNPSTADEQADDATIRTCTGLAKRLGCGALCMTNLFAWRDRFPSAMRRADEPVGLENNAWLLEVAAGAKMVIAAWGAHGEYRNRAAQVCRLLHRAGINVHALRLNADGSPDHPLYLPSHLEPQPFLLLTHAEQPAGKLP